MLELNLNLVWTILNILILYFFLKKFLFKPVTAIMEKRTAAIQESFEKAGLEKQNAEKLKREYEQKIAYAQQEADDIIARAKITAEEEFQNKIKEARQEQEQIIKETRVAMEQERVRSLKQVQDEIAAIAILATSKIIGQHVDETANHQMFHELLKEVGEGQ